MPRFTVTTPVNGDSLVRLGSVAGLAWTRVTTTATVTQNNHGLATNDLINVTVSSDTGAIPLGVKTITFINSNSYSFTCVNTGAASGTITAAHIDTYLINGGYLTIDQDSRYGVNNNTSAAMGNITMSATLGGTIEFNATAVRLIPYNTGTGNVPASGTTISKGGASGSLIAVYSALSAAPTAAGAGMPASGFIKIKTWNAVAFTAGALTGIGANATGADVAGWIEIVGADALDATVNRLNTFKVRGDWYVIGTTDGTRATTYQIPSNGSSTMYLPGVWVETGTSTGVFEFYPMAGVITALLANVGTEAGRGKVCWISTSGVLRFGHDGTNSTGGYIPPSGRIIRIPNIFFMCCTQAALTANVLPNATLTTRYSFVTTGGGVIDMDKACMNWWPNFLQPFSVALTNFAALTQILVSEVASPMTWSQVGVGLEATTANPQFALSMALCFAGGSFTDCLFATASLASSGRYSVSITDIAGFTFTNVKMISVTTARGNATTGIATATRMATCTWSNALLGGGRFLLTTCTSCTFTNTVYFDCISVTTTTTNPMYAFALASSCAAIKIDGLTFGGIALVQPYNGILQVGATGCTGIKLRNLGTYASPLDAGGPRVDATYTRSTTTATVTSTAHGLKTGDIIYVIVSDSVAAITVAAKTLLSAADANTFTFTCLNAGAASGAISYYPTMSANLFVLAAGAAANTVEVKRCYFPHTRTGMYTADNSSKNILIENVQVDYVLGAALAPQLNGYLKGLFAFPAMTAQTSTYGTHWFDAFLGDIGASSSGVSWSRTTTTATVTLSGHKLKTGDFINVTVSSSEAAIVLGQKTVTVLTSSTFTFTCLNAGSASGTLTYQQMTSRIGLLMNEATSDTASQYTGVTGTTVFTSAGGLYMPSVNDEITFVMPNYCIGHTGFPIAEAVMAGGTIGNYDITYAIDQNDGAGYSTFKNLFYPRAGGGGSNGSTNVTMTDTTGVAAGDYVWGTNIAPNAKVQSITNGTTVVVDLANVGAVSGVLRFSQLPSQSVTNSQLGFKLKIKIKTTTANATAITSLFLYTLSTDTSRAYQYPLDLVPLTLTNLKNPSEVRVYDAGTTTEIAGQENVTSGTFTTSIDVAAYPDVDISILALNYQNVRYLGQLMGTGLSIPVSQVIDRQYLNP